MMVWQTTPYTVPLVVAALASFVFASYVLSRRLHGSRPLVWSFFGVALGGGAWALAYAAQLSATTLDATLFWNQFVWAGVGILAVAWPAFVAAYLDRPEWLRLPRIGIIAFVPMAVVIAVFTLGPVSLFYESPSIVTGDGGYLVLSFTPTPALLSFMAYTYVVNAITFVVLGRTAIQRSGVFRRQAALLFLAGVLPMGVGVVTVWSSLGPPLVDLTPISFAVTSGVLAWVLFRYRLLNLSPVARKTVFTNLSDGIVVVGSEGRIVDANDRARELFPSIQVGGFVESAFEDAPAVIDAVRTGGTGESARATIEGSSSPRFLTVSTHGLSAPGIAGDETDSGVVLLIRDVTERETLQQRYRALIEKSPNVIAVSGSDGYLRYVSPSVERLLGRPPNSLEGRPMIDLIHPDDRAESQRRFEAAFETDEPQTVEHRIAHATGDWRTFETVIERLFEDRTDEVVITATDVTEGRRHEQRLQVLNRVLRHDLKNDVNVIGGYADLLRDHVDEDGHEHLDVIDRKIETLTHLSDQAREIDIALHDDDQRVRIDLVVLVSQLCDSLETSFPEASVTLSKPESAVITADELLESAIRNVLENAVVHNDGDGAAIEVDISETDDGSYCLDIADDGPGIPPIERTVFSEGRETPLEHASGLGLWLVHWIVTGSGGDLEIHSREPTGTVVSMRFSAADAAAGPDADAATGSDAGPNAGVDSSRAENLDGERSTDTTD